MPEEPTNDLRSTYEKTMKRAIDKRLVTMSILVTDDTYDKALTAFNIAVAGVEIGMNVSMFFTSRGVNIIKKAYKPRRARWGESPIGLKEAFIKRRGGSVLAKLMYEAKDMGVHFYCCYTSMVSTGLKETVLLDDVKVIRMAEYLGIVGESNIQLVIG
ncbi:MAG TPA: DsrE/DsrF/DrsH-like family protein [Candidatus Thermoplasmatota archaeon]|nr:DsrE/DsrF/DrsH-like family protein [Candidatus Thermoplasmatota archaeon]